MDPKQTVNSPELTFRTIQRTDPEIPTKKSVGWEKIENNY